MKKNYFEEFMEKHDLAIIQDEEIILGLSKELNPIERKEDVFMHLKHSYGDTEGPVKIGVQEKDYGYWVKEFDKPFPIMLFNKKNKIIKEFFKDFFDL